MELDKIQIKMVVAGSSTAISPGSIKGSHQSVLDELKDKINRRRSISEISSKSVDLSVALAGSTSTSNPSKTRPISVDMATHSNISEKYAKEREESIGRVNFIATRPESRALMSQLNTKFRKVETSAPSISDDVDDGSEIDDQMKHGVLNENKTGKLGLVSVDGIWFYRQVSCISTSRQFF